MKTIGAGLAALVLLWCAAVRADEPIQAPAPLAPPAAAPMKAAPCASCSACTACNSCVHQGRLRAWLTYRPLHRTQCGECSCDCHNCRWVPLYLYFLGECKEHPCTACGAANCASCGCGCHGAVGFGGARTGWGMFGD